MTISYNNDYLFLNEDGKTITKEQKKKKPSKNLVLKFYKRFFLQDFY